MLGRVIKTSIFLLLAVASFSHPAAAQLQTGTISGTVADATGAVIPGVSVTLTSAGVIGGNQTAITDENGRYSFTRLVPGSYGVKAELSGFSTALREGVVVNAEATARVDLSLQVGNLSDTVTVTGEAPLLDTTSALNQQVMDKATRDAIPTGGDLWSIARLVPGALVAGAPDVGGNQSFQQSGITVHGNAGSERKYAIDGLDVSWAGGAGSTALYYDVGMFQEVNYQVGAISAENAQGGVVMNMVTRTGTNDFHGDFYFFGTNSQLQSDNLSDALRADLLQAIPARVRAANPNISPRTKILGLFDSNLSLSGPIVKDKLWWTGSLKLNSLNQLVTGSYNADGTQAVDDNRIKNASGKLSWQMNSNNQLHYSYNRNEKYRYHRRSQTFTEDRAAHLQDQPGYVTQLKWTSTVNSRLVLDASLGYSVIFFPTRQQPQVREGDMSIFDITTSTLRVAAPTYSFAPADRGAININASYFTGKHELKVGYQWNRSMEHQYQWSMNNPPMQARFRDDFTRADSVIQYSTPTESRSYIRENAWFAQDKWQPTRKLTVNMGLRVQKTIGYVPAACHVQTAFVPAQCFGAINNVPDWLDIAPRLSVVYDLFGDGRTAIKASANHYNRSVDVGHPRRLSGNSTASRTVPWTDVNGDRIPQMTELDPNPPAFNFGTTNRYAADLKRPTSDEFSLEIEQQLPLDLVLAVGYTHRDNWRGISSTNKNRPRELAWQPLQYTVPASFGFPSQTVTIYNIRPQYNTLVNDTVFENASARDNYFNGVDITINKRMSNRFMILSGLSLGSNNQREGGDYNNPNTNWYPGETVGGHVPVQFKLAATIQLPYGVDVSPSIQHFTGRPESRTFDVTRAQVLAQTGVSITNASITGLALAPTGTDRLPDNNLIDISIRKNFAFGDRFKFSPNMDIFNLTNAATIQGRVTNISNTYGRVSDILAPRMFRLGFKVDF